MGERAGGGLLLVSRSMPPDIGGYQSQMLLLLPHLCGAFRRVVWVGAVRDAHRPASAAPHDGARLVRVPAAWIPRFLRGAADPLVVLLASVHLVWGSARRRPGAMLVLSPTMVGAPLLVLLGRLLGWRTSARFPSRGDQMHRRGRRVGVRTNGVNLVPSPGQMDEQPEFPVTVVLNAVQPRDDLRSDPDPVGGTFLFVGRFIHTKRPQLVLDAWRDLADGLPAWRMRFVGDGGSESSSVERALLDEAHRSRVPRCTFTGPVSDPMELMRDAEVLVFPSTTEGLPNSMLEALAVGLPVLADRELAASWFGRPVPLLEWDGEASTLRSAMERAAGDVSSRRALRSAGPAFASAHHDPSTVAALLTALLHQRRSGWRRRVPAPAHGC